MDKKIILILTTLLLATLACNLARQDNSLPAAAIGTLSRVSDAVEHNDNPVPPA